MPILYICIILFLLCVLSCCCLSVLLSFCHYNKFLVRVNIPGNKAHSQIYACLLQMFDDLGVVCLLTETKPPGLFEHSLFDGLSFEIAFSNYVYVYFIYIYAFSRLSNRILHRYIKALLVFKHDRNV